MKDIERRSARTRWVWACGASTTAFAGIATAALTGHLGQLGFAEGTLVAGCVAVAAGRVAWELVEMVQVHRPDY